MADGKIIKELTLENQVSWVDCQSENYPREVKLPRSKTIDISRKFCGAYARTTGNPCLGRPMSNGRCKLHGGKSTGATSIEGKKRVAEATSKRMLGGQKKLALEGYKRWLENGGRLYLSETQKTRWKLRKWILRGYKPRYKYDKYLPKFKEFKRYLERQSMR